MARKLKNDMPNVVLNPAELAAEQSLARLYECIEARQSFRLEAGAGAGKTYSLVKVLQYLIRTHGVNLQQRHQQVACITYTNVASDQIKARTDGHPAILASTIHAFCWSLIKDFQPQLRDRLSLLPRWTERLAEIGGIGSRRIDYELGHPRAKKDEDYVSLHHDDVVSLTAELMNLPKFQHLLVSRYPILLIDEYQDTDEEFANALKTQLLGQAHCPLIGLFGDHWQKIYDNVCGKIEHPSLVPIDKHANFRSVSTIVDMLNRMRPELPQHVQDPTSRGQIAVFHTNNWRGTRRKGSHWKGDLPEGEARKYFDIVKKRLIREGWDFAETKVLMLTHAALAKEQGYAGIAEVFQGRNEQFAKKEDPYVEFLVDTVEPVCSAYMQKKFGEMFAALGDRTPTIKSHADKESWVTDMNALVELRRTGTIGAILDHIKATRRPRLSEAVERREKMLKQAPADDEMSVDQRTRLQKLRELSYQEIIALDRFIDGNTPFSTKHNVKGAEFENVLVVLGRGWQKYDFNAMLEMISGSVPSGKQKFFEDNRNLFYVCCSRPKTRLALLFTQELSSIALQTLTKWFGASAIHALT